jgi:hypothetical protein
MKTMRVYGCFGYNDSPEDLGEPSGFWVFENYAALWSAFEISEELNQAFDQLGAPTYSAILWGVKDQRVEFQLFVMSVKPIRPRETELLAQARRWMAEQGIVGREIEVPEVGSGELPF